MVSIFDTSLEIKFFGKTKSATKFLDSMHLTMMFLCADSVTTKSLLSENGHSNDKSLKTPHNT